MNYSRNSKSGTRKEQNDQLRARMELDKLTTMCRETIRSLYGTKYQSAIGPIKWCESQVVELLAKDTLDSKCQEKSDSSSDENFSGPSTLL